MREGAAPAAPWTGQVAGITSVQPASGQEHVAGWVDLQGGEAFWRGWGPRPPSSPRSFHPLSARAGASDGRTFGEGVGGEGKSATYVTKS